MFHVLACPLQRRSPQQSWTRITVNSLYTSQSDTKLYIFHLNLYHYFNNSLFIFEQKEPTVLALFICTGILYQDSGALWMKLLDRVCVLLVCICGSLWCRVLCWWIFRFGVNSESSGRGSSRFWFKYISFVVSNWCSLLKGNTLSFWYIGHDESLYFELVTFRIDLFCSTSSLCI